jgi:hypothetical protein
LQNVKCVHSSMKPICFINNKVILCYSARCSGVIEHCDLMPNHSVICLKIFFGDGSLSQSLTDAKHMRYPQSSWSQGLMLTRQALYHLSFSASIGVWCFFSKIVSHELFALAGFEPWSTWSLPPE